MDTRISLVAIIDMGLKFRQMNELNQLILYHKKHIHLKRSYTQLGFSSVELKYFFHETNKIQ